MAGTVVDVEKIAGRFDQTSKETAAQLSDRTARMRVATEEVAKLSAGLATKSTFFSTVSARRANGIKRHESDLVGHLQQAFSHLGTVAERLDSTRVLASNVSEAAIAKLNEVGQKRRKANARHGRRRPVVHGHRAKVTQTYADQAQRVNGTVLEAQNQIISMSKAVEEMQATH
jgi:hypothetical protein